jgi:hypothetical protein
LLAAVVGNDDAALVRRLRVRSLLVRRLCIHNLCEKREKGERERERAMRESDGVFLPLFPSSPSFCLKKRGNQQSNRTVSRRFTAAESTYTYCGIAQTLIKGNAHRTLFASDSSRASGSEPTSLQILRGRIDHIMPDRLAQAAADLVEDKALFEAV